MEGSEVLARFDKVWNHATFLSAGLSEGEIAIDIKGAENG
jgi:hypothetical protein